MSYDGDTLAVSASGDHPPRSAEKLKTLISKSYRSAPPVTLQWTYQAPRTTLTTSADTADTARATTDSWIMAHPDTSVLAVNQTPSAATVTLTGPIAPPVEDLRSQLHTALPALSVTIEWLPSTTLSQSPGTPASTEATPPPR
ncbi:MAG: hypothetical protein M3Z25_16790 [Actinomycetota bacterium]|nr:hypothetical protein [Actinomycetota bacterium]